MGTFLILLMLKESDIFHLTVQLKLMNESAYVSQSGGLKSTSIDELAPENN